MADQALDRDEAKLAELGYKQELTRGWSRFSNFAISFTIISVLAGCFTTYPQAWNLGGPIAISWGWPIVVLLILPIAFSMAEVAAAYPTAGGPYWWANDLGVARRDLHRLRGDPRAARDDQHLLVAPGGALQQHLSVLALRRRADHHRDPYRRPGSPPERGLRLHRPDQQLRLQHGHVLVVHPAHGPAPDHVHGHRLRRVGARG